MTEPRLWDKLHLSQWGRLKAMANYLGFEVHRLKIDQCRLLMRNVKVDDIIIDIDFTDSLTNMELSLSEWIEEVIDKRFKRPIDHEKNKKSTGGRKKSKEVAVDEQNCEQE